MWGEGPPVGEEQGEAPRTLTEPPISRLTSDMAIELDERAAEFEQAAAVQRFLKLAERSVHCP